MEMGHTMSLQGKDGFTAAPGWEVDQMQWPSVCPEPLGFLIAIKANEVGCGGGTGIGERLQVQAVFLLGDFAQDECSWENNSPEKQYRHRPLAPWPLGPLAGIGCQGPDSIVLLPPWGPDESRPPAA